MKLEILSYEQVIKLFQEELSNKELCTKPDPMEQKDYYDEQLQFPTSKDDWIEVTLNINMNPKVCNINFIQLIPHTANRFELLSNLKEESVTSSTSNKKEETPNIGNLQEKIRKTHIVKSLKKEKQKVPISLVNKDFVP